MRRRSALPWAMVGLAVLAGACAKRIAPAIPAGEEYVFPAATPGELSSDEAKALGEAWREILAGDAASAAQRCERLLARRRDLVPAQTVLAYARLRAGRAEEARTLFASVLERRPEDVAALVGAASAELRRSDAEAALAFYKRAQAVAPEDMVVRKHLAELKLQVTERRMAQAQSALAAGDTEAAAVEYRGALRAAPELTSVRLALADLLVSGGDPAGAAAVLEGDPTGDRGVALRLGGLLAGQQEFERAAAVYDRLLARDPKDAAALAGARTAREGLALLAMPEEYRAIADALRITRADLAALLAVRVPALAGHGAEDARVVVDISGSWARGYIATVVALGIMDPYPNHTFQPGALVRRVDLARAVARALDRLGLPRAQAPAPSDMAPAHLDYGAVTRALGAGLMGLTPEGAFEPWRPVSGREATSVVDALARLTGSP
jgi:tetratricopeptide (TPR) repeat protein